MASAFALPTSGFPSAAIVATGTVRLNAKISQVGILIAVRFSQSVHKNELALAR
jgi:hypothetical protein